MLVWNLTKSNLFYHGVSIGPGEGKDFDLPFIPDRDQKLETNKVLAFGSLPDWYLQQKMVQPIKAPEPLKVEVVEVLEMQDEVKTIKDVVEVKLKKR